MIGKANHEKCSILFPLVLYESVPHKPLSIFVLNTYWPRFYSSLRPRRDHCKGTSALVKRPPWREENDCSERKQSFSVSSERKSWQSFLSAQKGEQAIAKTQAQRKSKEYQFAIFQTISWTQAFDVIKGRKSVKKMICSIEDHWYVGSLMKMFTLIPMSVLGNL